MNSYWISNPQGEYALVEGTADRDTWTKVHGWSEATEPGPTDQVFVVNENPEILPGRLPYAAVALHAGLGWKPGPPPPVGVKPAEAEPKISPAKASATSGDKKEQVNG